LQRRQPGWFSWGSCGSLRAGNSQNLSDH
jgi:hypothetical protein